MDDFQILYVDDEQHNLITFKATFRRKYKIHTASSGEEGLQLMRKHDLALVISDQRMPGMTGVAFLEQVAREFPDVIRIILTGYSDVEAIINAINKGEIFRYITKPWSENELQMTIENARQLHELEVNNRKLVHQLQQKMAEQEKTLRLFRRYVPAQIVQKTLEETGTSIFEGTETPVAVLFCDIRGFTQMSEKLPPATIVSLLNDYYAFMTESVNRHLGYVCQFVGDEVFAAFGAPVSTNSNEENAVFCGLEMIDRLKELNIKYKEKVNQEIVVGIGIHAGMAITGNVGSEDHMNYAVTGATVNTGRRIEMITKETPNAILISEIVYRKTQQRIEADAFGSLEIPGRPDPVKIYRLLGRKDR
jgi:class 3 adenylate cyclase/CheY-like chemotaxis protein